jgi:hypothetical protein
MTEAASIVVFTEHLDQSVAFDRSLGVPLEDEDHSDGFIHAAGEMGGVHVAVLPSSAPGGAAGWRAAGSTFVGLRVPSLDAVMAALELLAPKCSAVTRTASGAAASSWPTQSAGRSR